MKQLYFLIIVIIIVSTSFAQTNIDSLIPKGGMGDVKARNFTSAINHHDYTLLVKLPPSYSDTVKKTYPVLYALDGQWSFPYLMEAHNTLFIKKIIGWL